MPPAPPELDMPPTPPPRLPEPPLLAPPVLTPPVLTRPPVPTTPPRFPAPPVLAPPAPLPPALTRAPAPTTPPPPPPPGPATTTPALNGFAPNVTCEKVRPFLPSIDSNRLTSVYILSPRTSILTNTWSSLQVATRHASSTSGRAARRKIISASFRSPTRSIAIPQ